MAIQRRDITPPDWRDIHISCEPIELDSRRKLPVYDWQDANANEAERIREDNAVCLVVAAVCAVIVVAVLLWAFGPDVPVVWR